ncbi:MAG TPA: KGG domain-containing protein [Candidatus Nanoarchaeia archaeon]|nr:KGG domain-containing protein [Candidatus Nanoarchaeia archaeon]
MAEESKGDISVKEAGKKGGEETSRTHGKEFYEDIGKKGGEETSRTHGREFYQEIGHKGGQRVRELIKEGKQAEGQE